MDHTPHVNEVDGDGIAVYTLPNNTTVGKDPNDYAVAGVDYWKVEASGSIRMDKNKVVFVTVEGDDVEVMVGPESNSIRFQVIPVGTGRGKITVTYYVWVAKPGEELDATTRGGLWIQDDLVLNVDVKPCTGFEMCGKL